MKKVIEHLFHPSAFKLGCVLTASFMALAFQFYTRGSSDNWLTSRLEEINQKSIDIRIRDRGPKPPSKEVALVVVDELAEQKLGRWPWPRGRIAEIIDLLVSYGTKVIAFDAVFVEPDKNQAVLSLSKIKESNLATGELAEMIDQHLRSANTDWVLAKTVEKHSDKLVMGSYFDEPTDNLSPFQEYCGNMLLEKTPWYTRLKKEEAPAIIVDSVSETIPEAFKTILESSFAEVEKTIKANAGDKNPEELASSIAEAKSLYCDRWLLTGGQKDEYIEQATQMWMQTRESIEGWSNLNYVDAMEKVRSSFLKNEIYRTGRWWTNLPLITEGTKHTAYFNAHQDGDGTIRRSDLITRHGDVYMTSLALKSVLVGKGWNVKIDLDPDPINPGAKAISKMTVIDDEGNEIRTIPADGKGSLLINYAGDQKTYPHVSVYQLFNKSDSMEITVRRDGEVIRETVKKMDFFKDKYLVFGATSTGIYDLRVTPFSENFPGVETHANLIDNLLNQNYLVTRSDESPRMLLTLGVIGLILAYGISHMGAVSGLFLTVLCGLIIYCFDRYYLFANGIIVTIVLPFFMVSSMYVIMTFYKYLTEERKKKALKGTFEKYVSPAIVAEVLKHPDNVALGGKKQRMTVMFSDLRGFTTISEKLDPQVLVEVLNKYLTPMTALVFKNSGTLDKYMGDAIMSFFGAPLHYADHAKKCCQCAIEMIELLPKINQDFKAQGLPTIDVGIGINTGEMSVGNMGSETVRSFTVMGDAVNLGSRLEAINKQYGTRIIISEYTYEDVKDEYVAREVDWVRVKGKRQPVRIFELIAHKSKFKNPGLIQEFQKGYEAYHQKSWDRAIDHFTKALILLPNDPASRLYVERSQDYKVNPPPDDWDGVYEMKTK
jgi:adenylate cyclase